MFFDFATCLPVSAVQRRARLRKILAAAVLGGAAILLLEISLISIGGALPLYVLLLYGLHQFSSKPRGVLSDRLHWRCPQCQSLYQTAFPISWHLGEGVEVFAACPDCRKVTLIRLEHISAI